MYSNPYAVPRPSVESLNAQIQELERMKTQAQQYNPMQPSINQTFQLSPSSSLGIRYANSIDDVRKELVFFDTPFFNKEMTLLWVKNTKGDIKAYEINEIIQKDEKDLKIEYLMAQIDELKKENNRYEQSNNKHIDDETTKGKPSSSKSNSRNDK